MKRKTLTLTLCILACFAVISVGFAAWIITNDAKEEVTGNITVDNVVDNTMTITVDTTDIKSIVFGGLETDGREHKWLVNNTAKENLTVKFEITVKKGGVETNDVTPEATIAVLKDGVLLGNDATDPYHTAITKKLITAPTVNVAKIDGDGKYQVTVTYAWGTAFDGKNPMTHYDQPYTDALKTKALENLQLLYALNTNYKFKVTLIAKAPTV